MRSVNYAYALLGVVAALCLAVCVADRRSDQGRERRPPLRDRAFIVPSASSSARSIHHPSILRRHLDDPVLRSEIGTGAEYDRPAKFTWRPTIRS